jgi:hypothetical protein
MSDQQYLTYQRCFDDELIERYYSHGLTNNAPNALAGADHPGRPSDGGDGPQARACRFANKT